MLRHFLNDLRFPPNGSSEACGKVAVNLCFFHAFFDERWVGEGVLLVWTLTNVKRILGTTAAQETAEMAIRTWQVERLFHWGHDL